MKLRTKSSDLWLSTVMTDFDSFLLDHAACERKASATALSFVAHYPDRRELCEAMIEMAIEELDHFRSAHKLITERDLVLRPDEKDAYVRQLLKEVRRGTDYYFLDRLLIAGVVEARGCERFGLVAEALPPGSLKDFYVEITRAEARHHGLFVRLARVYFSAEIVSVRLEQLLEREASILQDLPVRARLH